MATRRERVVVTLTWSITELTGAERNHRGHDQIAVETIHAANEHVIELRDRYASAPEPIRPAAAHEIRDLVDLLRKLGENSGSTFSARDLRIESENIKNRLLSSGVMLSTKGFEFLGQ
jgi:hypothetical protein